MKDLFIMSVAAAAAGAWLFFVWLLAIGDLFVV